MQITAVKSKMSHCWESAAESFVRALNIWQEIVPLHRRVNQSELTSYRLVRSAAVYTQLCVYTDFWHGRWWSPLVRTDKMFVFFFFLFFFFSYKVNQTSNSPGWSSKFLFHLYTKVQLRRPAVYDTWCQYNVYFLLCISVQWRNNGLNINTHIY